MSHDVIETHVLIVDDRAENLLALEAVLEPLNVPVTRASSGEEALKCVLAQDFAVVLLDVQMPGLSGLETAQLIKGRKASAHVPIIFITAISRETAYVVRSYGSGAVDYLLKPVDPDILRSKVAVFVELYRRGEEIRRQTADIAESRAKDAFLAAVAHELRTPLAVAKAQAQLAMRQLGEQDVGPARAFALISSQIHRVERLVDDLLDVSRIEGGQLGLQLGEFDVRAVLDDARNRMAHLGAHTITVESPSPLMMIGDRDRIEQVIVNLIGNAQRYSPDGGPIAIEATSDGEAVTITVSDHGLGIPADKHARIFERFGTAHGGRQGGHGGLGLGLTISKGIVEQHGGTITVESPGPEGVGSVFRVKLPVATSRESAGS